MIDTKKLISGFLILASIVSSLSFIFSGGTLRSTDTKPTAEAANNINYLAKPMPAVPANAFVEKVHEETADTPIASVQNPLIIKDNSLRPIKHTSNLTDLLAQYVAREFIIANPSGPQKDPSTGETNIESPKPDELAALMAKIPEIKNFKVPDWNDETETAKLAIVNNPSKTDQEKYVEFLGAFLNKYYLQSDLTSVFYKDPGTTSPNELLSVATGLENAAKETKSAAVPAPLADFHKALLTTIVYERNTIALGANASEDPVRASLVLQAQQKNIAAVISNFQNQFQKSGLQQILSARPETKGGVVAFLNNLIGAKTAYAQYPTFDMGGSLMTYLHNVVKWIVDNIQSILLQVLKNILINNLQTQIMDWAKSGFRNTPAFITNWKQFVENSAFTAAGAVIGQVNPKLCSGLRPLIQLAVRTPPTIGGIDNSSDLSCSLNLIGSISGFYRNFADGGWKAYGTVFQIQNNYFGDVIEIHDSLLRQTANAKTTANNNAQATGGFKNRVKCPSGYTQTNDAGDCQKTGTAGLNDLNCSVDEAESQCTSDGCTWTPNGVTDVNGNMGGSCTAPAGNVTKGETFTPGYTTAGVISSVGTGSSQHLVVNAANIIGLLTAMVTSLINRVIQNGF